MKVNNIDIEKMDTIELLKARRGSFIMAAIMSFFAIMCIFLTVVLLMELSRPPESHLDDNSFFSMMLPFSLGGSVFFFFMMKPSVKQIIAINKELTTRPDLEKMKTAYKADSKENIKIYAIVAVVILIFIILIRSCSFGGSSGSNGGCRNCGRTGNLVPGYGYCYDCFDGYLDWEERTND